MLELSCWEFLLRVIPETSLMMFAIYTVCKERIKKDRYVLSVVVISLFIFFVRMLPISYGVHTILISMLVVAVACIINKIQMVQAIRATLILIMILLLCECSNMIILLFLDIELKEAFASTGIKLIFSLPSLIMFFIIILCLRKVLKVQRD